MKLHKARSALLGVTLAVAGVAPGVALADWTRGVQDERCSPASADALSQALREAIEGNVRRAEAVILPPTPVGDLGCLNDLMTAPLDSFSGVGGMLGALTGGLGNFDGGSIGLDIDVSGMICRAAAERWADLTQGLSGVDLDIPSYAGVAARASDRLASGGISFIPGVRGSQQYRDSSGSTGGTGTVPTAPAPGAPAPGNTQPAPQPAPTSPANSTTAPSTSGGSSGNSIWDSLVPGDSSMGGNR